MTQPSHLARRVKGRAGRELRGWRTRALQQRAFRAEHQDLLVALSRSRGAQARELAQRLHTLLRTLGQPAATGGWHDLAAALETAMADADGPRVWLALAVLTGQLPLDEEVVDAQRRLRLDGPRRAFTPAVVRATSLLSADRHRPVHVEVVTGAVTVDAHHTSQTDLATGIQRVARETARRWDRDHDIVLLGWTPDYTALRRLDRVSHARATGGPAPDDCHAAPDRRTVVVPWTGTHLTVELATEEPRTMRMLALARHSGNRTAMIGFDCVPLTTAETAGDAMGGAFAQLLAAVRHMDRVAAISHGAALEYLGWRDMLVGAGLEGPQVEAVPLPVQAQRPTPEALDAARSRFTLGSLPVVLCVGSHEPRKNHLAVLHAGEVLWRRGLEFSMVFVGGNSWKSERFIQTLNAMRDAGRPIESVSALSDDMLWGIYALAHVVLFPSLNEGFGLPVAEALAGGTPVITSGFGSMAEIATGGGALLVDPRDDHDIADALSRMLTTPGLRPALAEQAAARPRRSWDTYAEELWQQLVGGSPSGSGEPAGRPSPPY